MWVDALPVYSAAGFLAPSEYVRKELSDIIPELSKEATNFQPQTRNYLGLLRSKGFASCVDLLFVHRLAIWWWKLFLFLWARLPTIQDVCFVHMLVGFLNVFVCHHDAWLNNVEFLPLLSYQHVYFIHHLLVLLHTPSDILELFLLEKHLPLSNFLPNHCT